jgi:hypothetical protein
MPPTKKGAAPATKKKSTDNRDGALYLRAGPDLLAELDAIAEELRVERPGNAISRADVVRELLYKAIAERKARGAKSARP